MNVAPGTDQKPATAARIYDYHLGGTHNFPADRAAAQAITARFPLTPAIARTGRAFLRRAVQHLADNGVRQFLDVGSGIPTVGNVHEIAQQVDPRSRVVYVDIDPVAVSESLEILEGNELATAIRGDVRSSQGILGHPQVRRLLDFDRPVGVLLCAVLHFVTDDEEARAAVGRLLAAVPAGSYVVISHAAEEVADGPEAGDEGVDIVRDVYKRQTATPLRLRNRAEVTALFDGLELAEPGVVWTPQWRPEPGDPNDFADNPALSVGLCGVARKP